MNIHAFLIVICTSFFPLNAFSQVAGPQKAVLNTSDVEQQAAKLLKSGAVGFSVAMLNQDSVIWSKGYGFSDIDTNKPMTTATIQNVASVSKTVTGVAVMQLVESGQLDLDKDINHYLPFRVIHPNFPNQPITARQLLTHTSAIVDRRAIYNSEIGYHWGEDNPTSLGEFLQQYLTADGKYYSHDNFNQYAPGKGRKYSNIGYGLVAFVLENIAKEPLNLYSKKHLFTPLSMTATGWMLTEVDQSAYSKLYETNEGKLQQTPWYGLATWPDGGLRTNIDDFSKFFVAAINAGQFKGAVVLEQTSIEEMFTVQVNDEGVLSSEAWKKLEFGQGLTWNIIQSKVSGKLIGHSGGDPGVTTHAYFDTETKTGALLFINTQSDDDAFKQAQRDLLRALLASAKNHG